MKVASRHTDAQQKEDRTLSGRDVTFPIGIIGFSDFKKYRMETNRKIDPFFKLASLDKPGVEFVLLDPWIIKEDYVFEISDTDLKTIDPDRPGDLAVFTIITISRKDSNISANLAAPVVINLKDNKGYQLVLDDRKYPLRFTRAL